MQPEQTQCMEYAGKSASLGDETHFLNIKFFKCTENLSNCIACVSIFLAVIPKRTVHMCAQLEPNMDKKKRRKRVLSGVNMCEYKVSPQLNL